MWSISYEGLVLIVLILSLLLIILFTVSIFILFTLRAKKGELQKYEALVKGYQILLQSREESISALNTKIDLLKDYIKIVEEHSK